ncbi:MAG TPA: hypothetical protein VN670_01615 [Acidobacteriaceae bacterium]|nr:hypothetical protein [Acidobacteriaceae bacterium]
MKHGGHILLNAPRRLRAIAAALEAGRSVTDVAVKFRVPAAALRRVIVPKRRLSRSTKITPEMLDSAAASIRDGQTFEQVAASLRVNVSTLTTTMVKNGLTAKNLRPPSTGLSEEFELAVMYYKAGLKVSEITRRTGIKERTLYLRFKKEGVPLRQNRRLQPGLERASP